MCGRGCPLAKAEPLLTSERITNDDGSASDYFVRYLQKMQANGASSVKIPVTSVNGKTGDVVITFDDIVQAGGIDYDKLNDKLQELISGLESMRLYVDQKILELRDMDDPFDQYAFRTGFDYDINDALQYPSSDPLNDPGYDGFYVPHFSSESSQSAYNIGSYMTQTSKNMLHCLLFAIPRQMRVTSIGFCLSGSASNDVAGAKQQWKIGIYESGLKNLLCNMAPPYPDTNQWMRFPTKCVWRSNLMDTSKKVDSATPANTTYLNDIYYSINGYSGSPALFLRSEAVLTLKRGVYFVVISRTNSAIAPSYANEIKSTRLFSDDSESQVQGEFINLFPSFKDPRWYDIGPGTSGSFSSIQKNTNFIMTNLSANYLALPDNLYDTFYTINFEKAGALSTFNTFTDPLDPLFTSVTVDYGISQSRIGGPVFTGSFA